MTNLLPHSLISLIQEFFAHQRTIFSASDALINTYSQDLNAFFEYMHQADLDLENIVISAETIHDFEIYLRKRNNPENMILQTMYTIFKFWMFVNRKSEFEQTSDVVDNHNYWANRRSGR